ncbi:MAG: hypothetical protein K0S26_3038 [Bacteroidota bacterium]|jgi:hypothetical protein|nr:hypothetical protein [Bacteroidota bacterium]
MQGTKDEKPGRKPRIPLSPEELFYVKKIKELKEIKRVEDFKATSFYKFFNRANVVLAGFLSYCVLSVLVFSQWQTAAITYVKCSYDDFDRDAQQQSISSMEIKTASGEFIPVKTNDLFIEPQEKQTIYIGHDFIFNKILKVKLSYDERTFWHIYTYPVFVICVFAMGLGLFVYKVNKHLTVNGLLTVFGLFLLASLYFILV